MSLVSLYVSRKVICHGRVQGVGFRYFVKSLAAGYEVTGAVKNLPDGTVELLIRGIESEVNDFLNELINESEVTQHIKEYEVFDIPEHEVSTTGFVIVA